MCSRRTVAEAMNASKFQLNQRLLLLSKTSKIFVDDF